MSVTSIEHREALRRLIDAASEYGAIAAQLRDHHPEYDHLADIYRAARAHAEATVERCGEALAIMAELDWVATGVWALQHATDAQADYWDQYRLEIALWLGAPTR